MSNVSRPIYEMKMHKVNDKFLTLLLHIRSRKTKAHIRRNWVVECISGVTNSRKQKIPWDGGSGMQCNGLH